MLPEGSVQATNVWKCFRADRRRHHLTDDLHHILRNLRSGRRREWRWALRDVTLQIPPGQSVGLVGANGSGKSTLLKILARVMYPYAGTLEVSGRLGALIEVRAGIHPELTGRENVFLYGSLLGLPRRQVARRFDEIVAFAEVEEAIDRQVKFYSSGMQMRLGFGVAAFLEPHVLLVDEVLAVGDATFQQRCLDRMRTVLAQGTTLVFVSHDLPTVEATCTRGVWLARGEVQADGPVKEVLAAYRRSIEESAEATQDADGLVRVLKAAVHGPDSDAPRSQEPFEVRLVMESRERRAGTVYVGVSEGAATPIFVVAREVTFAPGSTELRCSIPHLPLPRGHYYLWVGSFGGRGTELLPWHPAARFSVAGPSLDGTPPAIVRLAPVHVTTSWAIERG